MQIILYIFPTMLLIIAAYLYLYRDALVKTLHLDKFPGIEVFSISYLALAILGFFIMANGQTLFVLMWLLIVVILTSYLSYLLYKSIK